MKGVEAGVGERGVMVLLFVLLGYVLSDVFKTRGREEEDTFRLDLDNALVDVTDSDERGEKNIFSFQVH